MIASIEDTVLIERILAHVKQRAQDNRLLQLPPGRALPFIRTIRTRVDDEFRTADTLVCRGLD